MIFYIIKKQKENFSLFFDLGIFTGFVSLIFVIIKKSFCQVSLNDIIIKIIKSRYDYCKQKTLIIIAVRLA